MKTEIFLSDVHVPLNDPQACAVALKVAEHVRPQIVTFGGDIVDFEGISRYGKPPEAVTRLKDDIEKTREFIDQWRDLLPRAEMSWIDGNHENRLQRYCWDHAPALSALEAITVKKLMGLEDRKITYYGPGKKFKIGRLWHGHGDQFRIGMGAVNPAVQIFRKYCDNIICGHFHRICTHFQTALSDTHAVFINGCLQDIHPSYDPEANWQQGISVIHYSDDGYFHVTHVPIIKGKAFYAGKHFRT